MTVGHAPKHAPASEIDAASATSCRRGSWIAFLATFVVHAVQIPGQGLTDDDDFYATAGLRYAAWLRDVVSQPLEALSKRGVDAAFQVNHEHPPLAKLIFGLAHSLFHDALGVVGDLDGARLGNAACAAFLSALLVRLLWQPLGAHAALAAPALLVSLPRFLFHSEVATLDVPVACAVVLVTAAFFWSAPFGPSTSSTRKWEVGAGIVFGLALLVKLNAPFAVLPCVAVAVLSRWRGFRVDGGSLVIPPIPRALAWMTVLGPVLFVVLWPWLWFDTAARLGAYIAFHLNHYPIYLFYDGEIWERPFAPWHAVVVLGFGVMPFPVVALGLLGATRAARALVRLTRAADHTGATPDVSEGDKLRALLLLQAVLAMAIVANPSTPRYGGEKLFMPFFPLFCALAADGAALVAQALSTVQPKVSSSRAALLVIGLAVLPGVVGTLRHRGGYALSYYGETVGGLRGAVARGYERTYYDVADKDLARFLDRNARGRAVHFEPNHKEYVRTYRWLKRDDVIQDVRLVDRRYDADLVVLTHERRWSTYPALKEELERWGDAVYDKSIDGVWLYTVYERRR